MVKHVGPLGGRLKNHLPSQGHGFALAALGVDLGDPTVGENVEGLSILREFQEGLVRPKLDKELRLLRPQLGLPQIIALLELCEVEELVTAL